MRTAERKMELQWIAPSPLLMNRGVTRLVDTLRTVLRAVRNRLAVCKLHDMSDAQLADIGIARDDVFIALEARLLDDPSIHLVRAAKRRAGSRFVRLRRS